MGSIATLTLGNLEIDWGKNEFVNPHSKLFLKSDIKKIDYYYAGGIKEKKKGYCRKLKDVKKRLELLGYSLKNCRIEYESFRNSIPEHYADFTIGFDSYVKVVESIDIAKIEKEFAGKEYDFSEYISRSILGEPILSKISNGEYIMKRDYAESLFNLDLYIILRLLMENKKNNEIELMWKYYDVVDGGYIPEEEIHCGIKHEEKFLIVTEGSSDTKIIKKAFNVLQPGIEDFFYYIDMKKNYPFTGTGNLFNFCKGLAKIKILNKVIIMFDNDAAGNEKYNETKRIALPKNIIVMKLPYLKDFKYFLTVGPTGELNNDINDKAVSIECFLDLNYQNKEKPRIRWGSYNDNVGCYQGSLINKDKYTKKFLNAKNQTKEYNYSKLDIVLEEIYANCINMENINMA